MDKTNRSVKQTLSQRHKQLTEKSASALQQGVAQLLPTLAVQNPARILPGSDTDLAPTSVLRVEREAREEIL